uniref:NADH dehydrogenase subunit 4L n=1 Tax=Dactylogyrus tuba TaxID=231340 RepID=UPI002E769898|nr:NADH dehydrogenase subunit 4L [Dactylogyrus tuba]WCF76306.1 NADH dehydrogenase subunit 4L [Dactylogyrus tuba]
MLALFISGLLMIVGAFSLATFKFMVVLLLVENLNILVLLFAYFSGLGGSRETFLIFMVVATVEVTLALVSLTRLWDTDSLSY